MFILICCLTLLSCFKTFYAQGKNVTPAVAFECGKPALYLTSFGWAQDAFGRCLFSESEVIRYCQKIYANQSFSHAVFSPVIQVMLRGWCHHENTNCSSQFDEAHIIQPWICTGNKSSQLIIPHGCRLRLFGGLSADFCHKEEYWSRLASYRCERVVGVEPVKPCIKSGSYLHSHFLGANVVCCGRNLHDVSDINTSAAPYTNKGARQSTKFRERQEFIENKKVQRATLNAARSFLIQQLLDEEAHLTEKDWHEKPEVTQESEDLLLERFRHDFVNLSLDQRQTRHQLESAHQQRVLNFMRQNEAAILSLLDTAVNSKPVNFTHVLEVMERVLYVIENNRYHVLRRFDRLRSVMADNTSDEIFLLRKRLRELDSMFNTSLLKLNKIPKFKPIILQRISRLRQTEYAHVESFARSMLVSTAPVKNDSVLREKAMLDAEELVNRYRHRFSISENTSGGGFGNWHDQRNEKRAPITQVMFPDSIIIEPTNGSQFESRAELEKLEPEPAAKGVEGATFAVVILLLLAVISTAFVIWFFRRRSRLRRAGYSSSLVEVDEVDNDASSALPSGHRGGFNESDVLTYWIPGGFENPSYKHAHNNLIR